jgi:hypothetical protein
MEHSPSWYANMSSASQDSSLILLYPKAHYLIHKRSPPVPQSSPCLLLQIHFNIILPSTLTYS